MNNPAACSLMIRILPALFVVLTANFCLAQETGYQKEVTVSEATRLDWVFALSNQSRTDPPAEWLEGYDSKRQKYELFVPPAAKAAAKVKPKSKATVKAKKDKATPTNEGLPVVLFISPGDAPAGWAQLQTICQQQGIVFASPFNAGNNVPMPKRVRIVLDVLDDLRRHHSIDPDRTYVGGFSGGGRTACGIAFALPELFGGVMPVCAGGDLREEPWLRHRVIDRLSVAMITGTDDFNLSEVDRFRGPMLTDMGVRAKVTVVPKLGHAIPDAQTFSKVIEWLDAGAADRRKLAQTHPASRIARDAIPTRESWAKSLFEEGQLRLKDPKTLYSGLMQLQGITQRWPDLKSANDAKQILQEYDSRPEHPWEADDIAEQRKFLIARARGLSAYATGELPDQYAKQRKDMLQAAINLWMLVVEDGKDEKSVAEAEKRLPELKKRLSEEPAI
ncbi:MAG: hypothetical protein JWM11_1721 [Planctomycetaceae bacterium]|nr:hypothetical protein [Planctomycetaceae bacterium]